MQKQTFATVTSPLATGDEPSILISTISLDRDNDSIVPEGGDFRAYLRNPVVGFQHFRTDPLPIGSTVRLDVEPGKGIRATWRWLEGDALASRVRNAYEQGVLRAASVGFLATEWSDIRETGGRRYTKWELTEWSLVGVPSNRDAVRTLRGLGLWEDDGAPVLELDDDLIEFDDRDFAPALRAAMQEAFARSRMNPAVRAGLVEPRYDVDVRELGRLVAEVVVETRRQVVGEHVRRALDRIRGRVD